MAHLNLPPRSTQVAVKAESRFINSINSLIPRHVHREKMHNMFRGGTADTWYSGNKADLWVEYKYIATPPKHGIINLVPERSPYLSPLQQAWLNARCDEGRNVAVIVGTASGAVILTNKAWMQPIDLNKTLLSKQSVAHWITHAIHSDSNDNSKSNVSDVQTSVDVVDAVTTDNSNKTQPSKKSNKATN